MGELHPYPPRPFIRQQHTDMWARRENLRHPLLHHPPVSAHSTTHSHHMPQPLSTKTQPINPSCTSAPLSHLAPAPFPIHRPPPAASPLTPLSCWPPPLRRLLRPPPRSSRCQDSTRRRRCCRDPVDVSPPSSGSSGRNVVQPLAAP